MIHAHLLVSIHSFNKQVPLGVLLKSEQKLEDMVDIMGDLQQYVPTVTTTTEYNLSGSDDPITVTVDDFHPIFLGKDL